MRLHLYPLTIVTLILLTGCGDLARKTARKGTPGGVEGGLATIDDAGKQQQVGDIFDGPVGEGMGRGFTRGVVGEGIALATGATQPSARPTTGPTQEGANGATAMNHAAPSVRTAVRDAALGLNDAFDQSNENAGVLDGTRDLLATALRLATITAVALGLLVLALGLWVWLTLAKARKMRAAAQLHEASTVRLIDALRAADGRPWAGELQALLREKLDAPPAADRSKSKRRGAAADDTADWTPDPDPLTAAATREARHGREEKAGRV